MGERRKEKFPVQVASASPASPVHGPGVKHVTEYDIFGSANSQNQDPRPVHPVKPPQPSQLQLFESPKLRWVLCYELPKFSPLKLSTLKWLLFCIIMFFGVCFFLHHKYPKQNEIETL